MDADGRRPIGCHEMTPKLVAYHVPYPYTIHDELIILLDLSKSAKGKICSLIGELAHHLDTYLASDYGIAAFNHDRLRKFRAYARQGTKDREMVATSPLSAIIHSQSCSQKYVAVLKGPERDGPRKTRPTLLKEYVRFST